MSDIVCQEETTSEIEHHPVEACMFRTHASVNRMQILDANTVGSAVPHIAWVQCREHKEQVSGQCSSEIFRRQENAADDFRLDKELYSACQVRELSRFLSPWQALQQPADTVPLTPD